MFLNILAHRGQRTSRESWVRLRCSDRYESCTLLLHTGQDTTPTSSHPPMFPATLTPIVILGTPAPPPPPATPLPPTRPSRRTNKSGRKAKLTRQAPKGEALTSRKFFFFFTYFRLLLLPLLTLLITKESMLRQKPVRGLWGSCSLPLHLPPATSGIFSTKLYSTERLTRTNTQANVSKKKKKKND